MKKSLLAVMAILLLCFTPAKAQTDDSNERAQQQIDSLNQIVAQLSEKVEDQEEEMEMADVWSRRKFFNIGFSRLKLTHREIANLSWKSDFSISLTYGKTIYFHKKPIANMIKFGLDYSFMDITYAKLVPNEVPTYGDGETGGSGSDGGNSDGFDDIETPGMTEGLINDLGCHLIDYNLQIGPSITVNPIDHLMVRGYFRYAPGASGLLLNEEFSYSYGSYFVSGGNISYKAFSLGVEARWGKLKYNSISFEESSSDDIDGSDVSDMISTSKNKMRTNSVRFYIGFRF